MTIVVDWEALSLNLFVTYSHKDLSEVGNPVRPSRSAARYARTPLL